MAKSRSAPGFLQRLQQSNAARARNVPHRLTSESLSIDLRNVAEPDRIYYARDAWVELDRGMVSFYFCQRRRDGEPALRSLVCVSLSPDHTARLLKSIEDMNSPGLAEIQRSLNLEAESVAPIPGEAEQTVELSATVARAAVSGYDSSLDFHKVPPIAIADAKAQGASAIKTVPQVRVDLRTSLFLGLVNELRSIRRQLPGKLVEAAEAEEAEGA